MRQPRSDERRHANAVLNNIIRPVAKEKGYSARRIDELSPSGRISEEIVEALYSADLVIADLAGPDPNVPNPNVMYELGVRQAWNLPVIQIAPDVTALPFDIQDINTVAYGNPTAKGDVRHAKAELKRRLRAVEHKAETPRIFADMFKKAREPFQMDAIRRAAYLAMRDLIGSLRERIREVEGEVNRASDEAFRNLAVLVRDPLKSLRDKRHVLVGIAEDAKDEQLVARLKALGELGAMGDQVVQMLENEARTSRTLKKVQEALGNIKGRAQRFAEELEPDR